MKLQLCCFLILIINFQEISANNGATCQVVDDVATSCELQRTGKNNFLHDFYHKAKEQPLKLGNVSFLNTFDSSSYF